MKISEKDIFDYVFAQGELRPEKLNYIEENLNDFSDEIELCKSSLNAFDDEEPVELPSSLSKTNNLNVFKLYKVEVSEKKSNGIVRLAADSPKLDKKISVDTFIDDNEEFIVKVISQEEKSKVYVFKNDNSPMSNFTLKFFPVNKVYHFESNKNPMSIDLLTGIEDIELKFLN